jgi:hypothetical protein
MDPVCPSRWTSHRLIIRNVKYCNMSLKEGYHVYTTRSMFIRIEPLNSNPSTLCRCDQIGVFDTESRRDSESSEVHTTSESGIVQSTAVTTLLSSGCRGTRLVDLSVEW